MCPFPDVITYFQIMFIGDSTNRGVMHYVIERVNDSLAVYDKTHDTKLYRKLNDGRTSASFSYYPQFWLKTAERPAFDETVLQLIRK